ncbi:DNA polymerase iota-like [Elysia marginata]|uniref:DNA polymerase iota-like n=1 Tax=Elysia marginata TaxID=1093978 RepID=A0AAV4FC38_9GAST|nr:DNA polymerase iota-like [Elysia marginata]
MVDLSPAYDFDEEEDWNNLLEYECNGHSPTKNDSKISAISITRSTEIKSYGHDRTIVHFDLDCFYAQVEMLKDPSLKTKPLGIQQKNIVVTCNYVAREFGVTKLMFVADAKKKCPQLVLVSGEDLTEYRHKSYQISEFFKKYTPHVERLGFDENFVDVSELVGWRQEDGEFRSEFSGHEYQSNSGGTTSKCVCGCEQRIQIGSQVAADMREALQKELGFTSCAGIAHNKVLAKLVAGTHKPNQQTSLLPHLAQDLILSLPSPRCIPGIGSKMNKCLQVLGISSVRDLQLASSSILTKEFGSQTATLVSQLSFGVDPSLVLPYAPPQTFSDEDSFKCCNTYQDAEQRIKALLNNLMKRVVEDGRVPQTVRLSIRRVGKHSNSRESRQTAVPSNAFTQFYVTGSTEIAEKRMLPVVLELFKKLVDLTRPFHLTLINVCFAKLAEKDSSSNGICRFFSNQSLAFEYTCEQQTSKDCGEMVNAENLEADFNDVGQCSMYSMPSQRETMQPEEDDQSVDGIGEKTALPQSKSHHTLEGFFVSRRLEEPTLKRNKSKNNLIKSKDRSNASCVAAMILPSSSFNCDKVSYCALRNSRSSSSQACEDLKPNFAGTLIETRNQDISPSVQSSIEAEKPTKAQGIECKDVINNKPITQESLKKFLPGSIDIQVLLALPPALQSEILGQHGILMEQTPRGKHFSLTSNPVLTRSQVQKKSRKRPLFSPKKSSLNDGFSGIQNMKTGAMSETPLEKQEDNNTSSAGIPMDLSTLEGANKQVESKSPTTNTILLKNVRRQLNIETSLDNGTSSTSDLQTSKEAKTKPNASINNFFYLDQDSEALLIKPTSPMKNACNGGLLVSSPKDVEHKSSNDVSFAQEVRVNDAVPNQNQADCNRGNFDVHVIQEKNITLDCAAHSQNSVQDKAGCEVSHKALFVKDESVTSAAENIVSKRPSLPQSVLKKLPKDISPEVFSELPSDIQGEIMAHVLMGTPVTVATGTSTCGPINSKKTTTTCKLSNSKRSHANSKQSQKSLLSYFSKKDK